MSNVPDSLENHIFKGYEVRQCIGQGGFGTLYRAYQPAIEREVAIKVILSQYANQPDFIRRFEAEAQLVARLEHPFIVPLFDYWRDPSGAYLVMRYLRGGNLRQLIDKSPPTRQQALRIIEQIAAALAAAHRSNVVHRDVKPENILLDDEGNAYLSDFGIAQTLDEAAAEEFAVLTGSPGYASPEQIRGVGVQQGADIYGLGVIVYELLGGRHPFADTSMAQMLVRHLMEPLPDIHLVAPDLPPAVNQVIQKATAKEVGERYADAQSLVHDLRVALGQPTPVVPAAAAFAPLINPYKGLRSFEEADAADFFGRESLNQRLLARLHENHPLKRFLALIGPSGSGKTSVVKAGLIPQLRRQLITDSANWFIAEMTPGSSPVAALQAALLSVAARPPADLEQRLRADVQGLVKATADILDTAVHELLLVIDQFEELFTQVQDEVERVHFLELLHTAVTHPHSRLRIFVTLRADLTDRPLQYAGFGELMRQRAEFVLPLSPQEIHESISGPARRAGLEIDPDLLTTLVADARDEPGTLPLLQYTLTELFERRNGRRLTLSAYQESGGLFGSLARRAEAVYQSLNTDQQAAARQIFLRLVSLRADHPYARRRTHRLELVAAVGGTLLDEVLTFFGRYRLLTFDRDPVTREPTVEVAHEALLREWERLRHWVDESRQDLQMERGLSTAVAEWRRAQYDADYLLAGGRLAQFEEWAAQTDLALSEEESGYLAVSVAQREQREAQERMRQEREEALERRSRQFLRILVVMMLLAALGGFALAGVAFTQRQEARASFARAESQRLASESSRILQVGHSPELAALLAIQALRIQQTTQADLALQKAAQADYGHRLLISGAAINMANYSPDGRYLAAGDDDGLIKIWDATRGTLVKEWSVGAEQLVYAVQFSPDSRTLFSSSNDIAQLWDVATGAERLNFTGKHDGPIYYIRFSPDGRTLASAGGKYIIFWDAITGAEQGRLTFAANNLVTTLAYAPDGRTLVSGTYDGLLRLWDVTTGRLIREMSGHTSIIDAVTFTPDGRFIVSGAEDNTARVWDVATGETVHVLTGHTDLVYAVAVTPDGRYLLTGSWDSTARLWDLATGTELMQLGGHSGAVLYATISPDGRTLLSAGLDGTIRFWDVDTITRDNFHGHADWVNDIHASPDGRSLVTAADDGQLLLWDATTGDLVRALVGHENQVVTAEFTADGRAVLSSSLDGTTRLWDVATGQQTAKFARGRLATLAPDGHRALIIHVDRTVYLLELPAGKLHPLETVSGATQVAFSPDGTTYVVGMGSGAQLFDATTDAPGRLLAHSGVSALAYSPDGRSLLTGGQDGSLRLWPLAQEMAEPLLLAGHTSRVWSAAFSPDGRFILTGGEDGLARLWDADDGREVRRFGGHGGVMGAVAFTPDGQTVFLGSGDGELWPLPLKLEDLITAVCGRVRRDLTAVEQAEYGLEGMAATCP